MEGQDGQKAISIDPSTIKTAQDAIGRLDVLVCGNCHTVSHFVEEFLEHKNVAGVCSNASNFRDNGNNEQKAQVWAFLLWKDSQIRKENPDREAAQTESWELYQKWCKMASNIRESWISAGKTIQTFTKLSNAKIPDSPRIINSQTSSPLSSTNETPKQTTMVMRKVMRNGQNEIVDVKKENKIEPPPLVPTNQKVIHNKQQNEQQQQQQQPQQQQPQQKQVKKSGPFVRPRCCIVPRYKPGKPPGENEPENTEEFPVEKIMAKRFNTKKRIAEYQIKWEGIHQDFNTWESTDCVYKCKYLLEEFDRNLAKQKEAKALKEALLAQQGQQVQQVQQGKKVVRQAPQAGSSSSTATATIKQEPINKPGPSTATTPGRPPRNSKTKAMDQVKQWCGSMKEEENELSGKRSIDNTDSDDEDAVMHKKVKVEACSDEDWTGESDMDDRSMVGGRSDVIQRAFNRATNVQSNGSNNNNSNNNKTTTATTMVTTTDLSHLINTSSGVQQTIDTTKIQQSPVMVTNSKGVKLDGNKIPQLASGVYMMHKRDGMLKFESASPTGNKMNVKNSQNNITSGGSGGSGGVGVGGVLMVQNRDGTGVVRKQVIGMSTSTTAMTPVKVVSKSDGTQVVTQMKVVAKPGQPKIQQLTPTLQQQQQQHRVVGIVQKNEPVKIQPKPEHQLQQQQQQQQQVQQLQIVTTVPGQVQPRMSTTPTIRQQTTGQVQRTPQLLPRTNVRGQTPTSVLGTRTQTVRTPISKQQQTMQLQQQRQQQMVQKRIISTNSPQSSPTQTAGGQQLRQKLTVSSSPQGQIVKQQIMTTTTASNSSVVSPMQTKQIQKIAQQKTPTSSTQQSIISPQQKILMAKKKIQAEAAANSSKTTLSPRVGTTTATAATVKTPLQSRVRGRPSTTPQTTTLPKQKETKIVEGDGIHMEFHEVGGSEDESDDIESSQTTTTTTTSTTTTIIEDNCQPPQSESPQPEYSLCPLTGRIIGPDGEPMDTSEPIIVTTQESAQTTTIPITISTPMSIQTTDVITTSSNLALSTTPTVSLSLPTLDSTPMDTSTTTTTTMQSSTTAEIVMPSLDGISEGGIMRVEMSPGGTSGTVVQTTNNTIQEQTPMEINVEQGLPCLDDTTITTSATATTTTTATTTLETPTTSITEETSILPTLPTTITSSCNITDTNTTINDTINKTIDTTVTTPTITSEDTTITTATDVALTSATITTTAASTTTTSTSTVTNDDTDNNINNEKTTDIEKTNDDNNTNIVDDGSNLVTITGEDGVVYQVAGQAPDGQTVLVAHGADGEQQCVYVTTDQQVEGGVLTLDHAVAEAVAQLIPDGQGGLQSQFYVKEGEDSNNEQQMVMSIMDSAASGQEDSDSQAQVVAQVVQADEPTPGGTRRVVLLLPDGNLMMTEVDEEQYAALELDK